MCTILHAGTDMTQRAKGSVLGIAASVALASKGFVAAGDADATFELSPCNSSICALSVVDQLARPAQKGWNWIAFSCEEMGVCCQTILA